MEQIYRIFEPLKLLQGIKAQHFKKNQDLSDILLEASCMTLLVSKPCATCRVFLSLHPSLSSSHLLHIRLDLVDCGRIRTAASFKEIIPTDAEPRYPAERVEAIKLWKIPVVGECLLTKGVMCNLHICRGKLQARLDLWFSPSLSYMFPQKIRCPDCTSVHHVGLGMRKHRKVRSQDSQRATSFCCKSKQLCKKKLRRQIIIGVHTAGTSTPPKKVPDSNG